MKYSIVLENNSKSHRLQWEKDFSQKDLNFLIKNLFGMKDDFVTLVDESGKKISLEELMKYKRFYNGRRLRVEKTSKFSILSTQLFLANPNQNSTLKPLPLSSLHPSSLPSLLLSPPPLKILLLLPPSSSLLPKASLLFSNFLSFSSILLQSDYPPPPSSSYNSLPLPYLSYPPPSSNISPSYLPSSSSILQILLPPPVLAVFKFNTKILEMDFNKDMKTIETILKKIQKEEEEGGGVEDGRKREEEERRRIEEEGWRREGDKRRKEEEKCERGGLKKEVGGREEELVKGLETLFMQKKISEKELYFMKSLVYERNVKFVNHLHSLLKKNLEIFEEVVLERIRLNFTNRSIISLDSAIDSDAEEIKESQAIEILEKNWEKMNLNEYELETLSFILKNFQNEKIYANICKPLYYGAKGLQTFKLTGENLKEVIRVSQFQIQQRRSIIHSRGRSFNSAFTSPKSASSRDSSYFLKKIKSRSPSQKNSPLNSASPPPPSSFPLFSFFPPPPPSSHLPNTPSSFHPHPPPLSSTFPPPHSSHPPDLFPSSDSPLLPPLLSNFPPSPPSPILQLLPASHLPPPPPPPSAVISSIPPSTIISHPPSPALSPLSPHRSSSLPPLHPSSSSSLSRIHSPISPSNSPPSHPPPPPSPPPPPPPPPSPPPSSSIISPSPPASYPPPSLQSSSFPPLPSPFTPIHPHRPCSLLLPPSISMKSGESLQDLYERVDQLDREQKLFTLSDMRSDESESISSNKSSEKSASVMREKEFYDEKLDAFMESEIFQKYEDSFKKIIVRTSSSLSSFQLDHLSSLYDQLDKDLLYLIDSFKDEKEANELKREVKEVLDKSEREGPEGKKVREVNYFEFILDKYEKEEKISGDIKYVLLLAFMTYDYLLFSILRVFRFNVNKNEYFEQLVKFIKKKKTPEYMKRAKLLKNPTIMNQMKLLYIYSSDFEQDKLKKLHKKIFDGEKEIGKVFQTFKKNKDKTAFIKSLQDIYKLDFSHHESDGRSVFEKLKDLLMANLSDLDENFLDQEIAKQNNTLEHIYNSFLDTQDVTDLNENYHLFYETVLEGKMQQTFKSVLIHDSKYDFSVLEKEIERGNKVLFAAYDLYEKMGNSFEMQIELKDTLQKMIDIKI